MELKEDLNRLWGLLGVAHIRSVQNYQSYDCFVPFMSGNSRSIFSAINKLSYEQIIKLIEYFILITLDIQLEDFF